MPRLTANEYVPKIILANIHSFGRKQLIEQRPDHSDTRQKLSSANTV